MRNLTFHVAPRYTAGSPAMVSEAVARHVAKQESENFRRCLGGMYGEEEKKKAHELGRSFIAYTMYEAYGKVYYEDIITGRKYEVPGKVFAEWRNRKTDPEFAKRFEQANSVETPLFPIAPFNL
jgi:hypothetical protein